MLSVLRSLITYLGRSSGQMSKETVSACSAGKSEKSCEGLSITGCDSQPRQQCEAKVRERAYLKWEAAGRPAGDGVQFWLQAEDELAHEESNEEEEAAAN